MIYYICILIREYEEWSECRKIIIMFILLSKFNKYFLEFGRGRLIDVYLDFIMVFYFINLLDYFLVM